MAPPTRSFGHCSPRWTSSVQPIAPRLEKKNTDNTLCSYITYNLQQLTFKGLQDLLLLEGQMVSWRPDPFKLLQCSSGFLHKSQLFTPLKHTKSNSWSSFLSWAVSVIFQTCLWNRTTGCRQGGLCLCNYPWKNHQTLSLLIYTKVSKLVIKSTVKVAKCRLDQENILDASHINKVHSQSKYAVPFLVVLPCTWSWCWSDYSWKRRRALPPVP